MVLQAVQLRVLFRQVVGIILCVELAAHGFKQLAGLLEAGIAVDMASQPVRDLAQVTLCHVRPDVADFLLHFVQHLCAVGAAKGIGGEVADAAAGPVGIL